LVCNDDEDEDDDWYMMMIPHTQTGRPVAYFSLRGHNRHQRDIEQYIKAIVYQSEELVKSRGGDSNYKIIVVVDRQGTGFGNQDIEMFKTFFRVSGQGERNPLLGVTTRDQCLYCFPRSLLKSTLISCTGVLCFLLPL